MVKNTISILEENENSQALIFFKGSTSFEEKPHKLW